MCSAGDLGRCVLRMNLWYLVCFCNFVVFSRVNFGLELKLSRLVYRPCTIALLAEVSQHIKITEDSICLCLPGIPEW